jgi:hypothetical protein
MGRKNLPVFRQIFATVKICSGSNTTRLLKDDPSRGCKSNRSGSVFGDLLRYRPFRSATDCAAAAAQASNTSSASMPRASPSLGTKIGYPPL